MTDLPKENKTAAPQQPDNQENLTFFNVMPKNKSSNLIRPVVKTVSTPAEKGLSSDLPKEPGFFKKNIKYFLIFIFLCILGTAGYFYAPSFFVDDYKSQNYLATQTEQNDQTSEQKNKWLLDFFGKTDCEQVLCGDEADPDHDGLKNLEEFDLQTDPNNADSDKDGIADGDEKYVFLTNPSNEHSGVNSNYTDADYAKNAYDPKTDAKYLDSEIANLHAKMKQFSLHQPTITTLEEPLLNIYKFNQDSPFATTTPSTVSPAPSSTTDSVLPKETDLSPAAKQDRDTQRSLTIKNIGVALVKYGEGNSGKFPSSNSFSQMYSTVKVYLKTATNPTDPLNVNKFVYTYTTNEDRTDFTLSYYSETLNQLIKKAFKDAKEDKQKMESAGLDDQRRNDLEIIRSTLLVYSEDNIAGNEIYVFPTKEKYKTALVPNYISSLPKDPKNQLDYDYQVSETFDTFTLKSIYDAPANGKTGYMCNQEECRDY
ncbi:MAG: hypothetical protein JNN11_02350 [Candidatus Doudnabacteria bacterium]|nr:hypothetical protein [Candidatus Doudnabacteria bacterium]